MADRYLIEPICKKCKKQLIDYENDFPIFLESDDKVILTCPKCGALLMTTSRECRYCGYVFPLSKKEVIEVELKELDYRTATKGRTVEELELIAKIKGYKQAWIWRTIFSENGEAALRDYARRKGYHHQWVKRQIGYYERK